MNTGFDPKELAAQFAQAHLGGDLVDPSRFIPPPNRKSATEVQDEIANILVDPPSGWKVALLPDKGLVAAPILSSKLKTTGDAISVPDIGPVVLEIEIGFRLGCTLGPMADRDEVIAAISEVVVGAEIVQSRLTNGDNFLFFLSENLGNAGYVMGTGSDSAAGLDIGRTTCHIAIDGSSVFEEVCIHANGDPLVPLLAYAAQPSRPFELRPGQIVTTGTLMGTLPLERPCEVEASLEDIGSVRFSLI